MSISKQQTPVDKQAVMSIGRNQTPVDKQAVISMAIR